MVVAAAGLSSLIPARWFDNPIPALHPVLPWAGDQARFAVFGSRLLSGDLAAVYADDWNQAGPVQLAVAAVARAVGDLGSPVLVQVPVMVGLFALVAWMVRRLSGSPTGGERAALLAVAALAVTRAVQPAWVDGHPWPIVLAALWIAAAGQVRAGRGGRAGALVGLGCLLEPWAVFGVGLLLVVSGPRRVRLVGAGVAVAVAAAGWLPFLVQPGFAMFAHEWQTRVGSVWELLGWPVLGWPGRVGQALLVAAAAWVGAVVLRRFGPAWQAWGFTVALVTVRFATDPVYWSYYSALLCVVLSVGAAASTVLGVRVSRVLVLAVAAVGATPAAGALVFGSWVWGQAWAVAALLAVAVWCPAGGRWRSRTGRAWR